MPGAHVCAWINIFAGTCELNLVFEKVFNFRILYMPKGTQGIAISSTY